MPDELETTSTLDEGAVSPEADALPRQAVTPVVRAPALIPGPIREEPVYATTALIVRATDGGGFDPDTLLALAKQRAPDPSVFDDLPPYFWRAQISSSRLDAYYTRMDPATTLRNFADDATAGVSFQNSHDTRQLGLGQSLQGRFIGAQGNGVARTEADFYTIPNVRLNQVSTDDFINGVRSGVVRDVSVGFYGGEFQCSICNRDMMRDYACPHIPGMTYDPNKPDDWRTDPNGETATATVKNARLAEVSAVYDGATPGAAILKAIGAAQDGRLTPQQARLLESRYRINLPSVRVTVPGADLSTTEETHPMAKDTLPTDRATADVPASIPEADVRAALNGGPDGAALEAITYAVVDRET